jgi:peroxiredoxin
MVANQIKRLFLSSVLLVGVLSGARLATAVEVGEKAPDFTLPSTTGKDISLSQFQGKQLVLIEFYGSDYSPVWAANLSARKADYSKFQKLNIQILGLSGNNPFSQKTFADSLQLPYPLLSDRSLKVAKAYGVVYGTTEGKIDYPGLEGLSTKRSFFLVDQQGIVQGRWIGEDLAIFSTEELLKAAGQIAGKPAEDAGEKKPSAMWDALPKDVMNKVMVTDLLARKHGAHAISTACRHEPRIQDL